MAKLGSKEVNSGLAPIRNVAPTPVDKVTRRIKEPPFDDFNLYSVGATDGRILNSGNPRTALFPWVFADATIDVIIPGDTTVGAKIFDDLNGYKAIEEEIGQSIGTPAQNYVTYLNWNVLGSYTDLIGEGWVDLYPGEGLYVDMAGSVGNLSSWAFMQSKFTYTFAADEEGTLTIEVGGSKRDNGLTGRLRVMYGLPSENKFFNIPATQDKTTYIIKVKGPLTGYLEVELVSNGYPVNYNKVKSIANTWVYGPILFSVKFEKTFGPNIGVLLEDNFDQENLDTVTGTNKVGTVDAVFPHKGIGWAGPWRFANLFSRKSADTFNSYKITKLV